MMAITSVLLGRVQTGPLARVSTALWIRVKNRSRNRASSESWFAQNKNRGLGLGMERLAFAQRRAKSCSITTPDPESLKNAIFGYHKTGRQGLKVISRDSCAASCAESCA